MSTTKWAVMALIALLVIPVYGWGAEDKSETVAGFVAKAKAHMEKMRADITDMTLRQTAHVVAGEGQTMTQKMAVFRKGIKSRTEIETAMPKTSNTLFDLAPVKVITVNDGKEAWQIHSVTGLAKLKKKEEGGDFTRQRWLDSVEKSGKIRGEEKLEERRCLVIDYVDEGKEATVWIDKESYMVIKNIVGEPGRQTETRYADFRPFYKEYVWPRSMEAWRNGQKVMTASVTAISANDQLDDTLFDVTRFQGASQ